MIRPISQETNSRNMNLMWLVEYFSKDSIFGFLSWDHISEVSKGYVWKPKFATIGRHLSFLKGQDWKVISDECEGQIYLCINQRTVLLVPQKDENFKVFM